MLPSMSAALASLGWPASLPVTGFATTILPLKWNGIWEYSANEANSETVDGGSGVVVCGVVVVAAVVVAVVVAVVAVETVAEVVVAVVVAVVVFGAGATTRA